MVPVLNDIGTDVACVGVGLLSCHMLCSLADDIEP